MKILSVIMAFSAAAVLYSCGSSDDTEWISRSDWGYNSLYSGNAAEAEPKDIYAVKEIAAPLVDAINFGNGIYNSAARIMMPDIRDSEAVNIYGELKTDNGSCYPERDNGTREYLVWPETVTNAESDIAFKNYCVENALTYGNMTVINDNATIRLEITEDNGTISEMKHIQSDNLSVKIIRNPSSLSDNYTFRGYIDNLVSATDNGTVKSDNLTIGADMPENETVLRFDMETAKISPDTKTITFYYPFYGYVTADISGIADNVQDNDQITIRYKSGGYNGGSCTFTPAEIDTDEFDCKSK